MALFRRKKDDATLPEVEEYYQAERRDRSGLAWLLAVVSMIVVAGILVLLFLGGRWVYDEVTGKHDDEDVATTETTDAPSFDGTPSEGTTPSNEAEQNQNETDAPAEAPAASTPSPSPAPTSSAPTTTPRTGDDELPRTGPADVAAVFAVASITGAGAHYVYQRRKLSR